MTTTQPRTPAGSPEGGQFTAALGAEAQNPLALPLPANEPQHFFAIDSVPGVLLATAAPPRGGGWNGFAVPRPTALELSDWVARVNAASPTPQLALGIEDDSEGHRVSLGFVCLTTATCTAEHDDSGCHRDETITTVVSSLDNDELEIGSMMFEERAPEDVCQGCGADVFDDSNGWDGNCGNCADRREVDSEETP